jgi:hypothetical protein
MINLEELILNLSILRGGGNYIDGIQLYDDILIYMPQLNKFSFRIDTRVSFENRTIVLSSEEDIQKSFIGREYKKFGLHVETLLTDDETQCRIHSLPYQFNRFIYLNHSYQGGIFNNVRCLWMIDWHPFEHNFFKIISQDFPFLEELCIVNDEPQTNKQELLASITFPHLSRLKIDMIHIDYAEQFLVEQKCHLPCLLDLLIKYESLVTVTNNFTNDATRLTCSKLRFLWLTGPFVRPQHFNQYFPFL